MRFFNFGNAQTYHFFRWVCQGGKVDPDKLVARALARVEGSEWYRMGLDVSTVARDKLAEMLADVLEGQAADLPSAAGENAAGPDATTVAACEDLGYDWPGALFTPLLAEALAQIDLALVARALLIRAGKWAPDREPPEAI
jgi:hypothetical protein